MDDDFCISAALAELFEFVNKVNPVLSKGLLSEAERDRVLDLMRKIDSVLGVMDFEEERIGEEARSLIAQREAARRRSDYGESDRLRDRLAEMGILVQDTPSGTIWWKK